VTVSFCKSETKQFCFLRWSISIRPV